MKFLPVNPDAIPATMKALNNWLYWKSETDKNGKPTKVPYVVREIVEAQRRIPAPGRVSLLPWLA